MSYDLAAPLTPGRCPLMEVPYDIRHLIYQNLLISDVPLVDTRHAIRFESWWKDHVGILLCSKTIYNEASTVLYSQNTLVYSLGKPWSTRANQSWRMRFSAVTSLGLISPFDYRQSRSRWVRICYTKLLAWNKRMLRLANVKSLYIHVPWEHCTPIEGVIDIVCAVLRLLIPCGGNYVKSPSLHLTLHKLPQDPNERLTMSTLSSPFSAEALLPKHAPAFYGKNKELSKAKSRLRLPPSLGKVEIVIKIPEALCEMLHTAIYMFQDEGWSFVDVEQSTRLKYEMVWARER